MKKIVFVSLFIFGLFLFSSEISAAAKFDEIKSLQKLNQVLKEEKIIYLDKNGLISLSDDLTSLGIKEDLVNEYKNMVIIMNKQIESGIISIDKNLNVKTTTIEEVAQKVYKNDQKNNKRNTLSSNTCIPLVTLVEGNRDELEAIYSTQKILNPNGAYAVTVGWWVGKVRENGAWDYKVQPGYSPWYKTFCMNHYNGFVLEHNSKWLGNYNYGYTGELLFSLSILHAGGDAISYLINWEPDTQEAKDTIEWGYSDAYYFY